MGIADTYDPLLSQRAGFLLSGQDPDKPIGDDGKRLLHLIYWLTYAREGREFLRANAPSRAVPTPAGRKSEADVEAILRAKFVADFNLTNEVVLNACVRLHFEATYWVDENVLVGQGDQSALGRREVHESNFKMYLSVLTWQLWEDGTGHEFSLSW
jgi:hypothetical protein